VARGVYAIWERADPVDCTNFSQRAVNFATNWCHSMMQNMDAPWDGAMENGGKMHFLFSPGLKGEVEVQTEAVIANG